MTTKNTHHNFILFFSTHTNSNIISTFFFFFYKCHSQKSTKAHSKYSTQPEKESKQEQQWLTWTFHKIKRPFSFVLKHQTSWAGVCWFRYASFPGFCCIEIWETKKKKRFFANIIEKESESLKGYLNIPSKIPRIKTKTKKKFKV